MAAASVSSLYFSYPRPPVAATPSPAAAGSAAARAAFCAVSSLIFLPCSRSSGSKNSLKSRAGNTLKHNFF